MKNRFSCLKHLRVEPKYAARIIMVCATIHNLATKGDFEWDNEENTEDPGLEPEDHHGTNTNNNTRLNEILARMI
jgi:hypothetical protein